MLASGNVCQPAVGIALNFPWNALTSALCPRIGTAIKERWFKGTSQDAIHQDDEKEYRD